jgi:hypothetical protein
MNRHTLSCLAFAAAASAVAGFSASAQAAVVNHADVNGIRTFQDTGTGLIWADLDQFLVAGAAGPVFQYADRSAYMAALTTAGFQWAGWAEVTALTGSVPVWSAAGYQDALDAMSTEFGSILGTVSGYSDFAPGSVMQWHATPQGWSSFFTQMPNNLNDSGLWAYYSAGAGGNVPAPGSLLLVGAALAALAVMAGRRRPVG